MKNLILMIGSTIVMAGVANAAQIVQTLATGTFQPNGNFVKNFNYFDTSLGTLTSVTIQSSIATWGGSFSLDNDTASAASGTATFGTSLTLSSFDVRLTGATTILQAITYKELTLAATTGDDIDAYNKTDLGDWGQVEGPTYASRVIQATGIQTLTRTGDFEGHPGQFEIAFNGIAENSFTGGNMQYAVVSRYAEGSVTLIYNYTAVPEPASMALLAIGCAVLGMRRRGNFVAKV